MKFGVEIEFENQQFLFHKRIIRQFGISFVQAQIAKFHRKIA